MTQAITTAEAETGAREFLRQADLVECNLSDLASTLEVSTATVKRRLRREKTTWERLKFNERKRRLMLLVDGDACHDFRSMALRCGYSNVSALGVFFKRAMGETHREWRMRRQEEWLY